MNYKKWLATVIFDILGEKGITSFSKIDFEKALEIPPRQEMGDYALPCFILAKELRKAPPVIAQELATEINHQWIDHVEVTGPYLNFYFSKQKVGKQTVTQILKEKNHYGDIAIGNGENITIDFSAPNIAKPFSMGHLRSTVIGNALANIVAKVGYSPVKINHLGDWGTQFGKLITAYKLWGREERVKQEPIKELLALYVRFHEEAETNPELEDQGRLWFKRMEDGDEEALELWTWFREESLKEFERIYQVLGVEFDSYSGEAFYNDKMADVVWELEEKELLVESDGAMVVGLEEFDMPPCLIKKSDGASLYATRDLAAALYRKREYDFGKSLYVVGGEQTLHFKQLFRVLKKMGYDWADEMHHISFGMMLKDGKKMSTRKGKLVLLEEVLQEVIDLALKNVVEKNPDLEGKEEVAKVVGVGAVIFHDLKNYRLNDIEFSLQDMLTFEGETGPYLQYTYARACSIIRKAAVDVMGAADDVGTGKEDEVNGAFVDEKAWTVIMKLAKFPEVIETAFRQFDPSLVAKYLIDLAQAFNKYYGSVRILEVDNHLQERLELVKATTIVLKEGLRLLGLQAPERM